MALKVMLSSVRRGLADVRDAAAPVIKILRYDVIRFETVTKTPVPARATCVAMVEDCDIYLLILGEEYGDAMPGTGKSPTEEEWTVARNLGKPTVVFKKAGIDPTPEQAAFIKKVEDYESGVWRYTFTDAADLISQLEDALKTATDALQPAVATRLATAPTVHWLPEHRGAGGGTVLETHVIAVPEAAPLLAATLDDLQETIATAGRRARLFGIGQALDVSVSAAFVSAEARDRGATAGIRVERDGAVTVWQDLPSSNHIGVVLDEDRFVQWVARDLRIASSLDVLEGDRVVVAAGFANVTMLGFPTEYNGMTLPFAAAGRKAVQPEPMVAWPRDALEVGADDIAREVVAGLMLHLPAHR